MLPARVRAVGAAPERTAAAPVTATRAGAQDRHRTWQTILDRWRSRAEAPAVVVGVRRGDGATWVGASGTPERDGHTPVRTDAPFRIASITKVFVAVVALQLVEEGRLGLDEPASRYAPDAAPGP